MVNWVTSYTVTRASIGLIDMIIRWESKEGYIVTVSGATLKRRLIKPIKDIDEAKKAAIRLAHRLATETLAELDLIAKES